MTKCQQIITALTVAFLMSTATAYAQTYQTYGNTTYGSDGSTAQRFGNLTYINPPQTPQQPYQPSVICQTFGNITYCN